MKYFLLGLAVTVSMSSLLPAAEKTQPVRMGS